MLSYRHSYHAGNFADVFKHAILVLLLNSLLKKDKPFLFLDTHAGAGLYAIDNPHMQKNAEYREGIQLLWDNPKIIPEIADYWQMLKSFNPDPQLKVYPGSPAIAHYFLRHQDRIVCFEKHRSDFEMLSQNFAHAKNVKTYHEDAYLALKGFVPPPERRGLIFLDPSYEIKTEYETVVQTIAMAHKRWATGIYALWYPILDQYTIQKMETLFAQTKMTDCLHTTFMVKDVDNTRGMKGCGIWIINPPWQSEGAVERLQGFLREIL